METATPDTGYTDEHARAGIDAALPAIDVWPNQFRGYEITIIVPEYTSMCPKTGLPDFGTITIRYMPAAHCLELKALKYYLLAYRNLGIFYENAVNRILRDLVHACQPVWAVVSGEFNVRGGMRSSIEAKYPADL
jgi:7-cyano-7-deazaguanine reductase